MLISKLSLDLVLFFNGISISLFNGISILLFNGMPISLFNGILILLFNRISILLLNPISILSFNGISILLFNGISISLSYSMTKRTVVILLNELLRVIRGFIPLPRVLVQNYSHYIIGTLLR